MPAVYCIGDCETGGLDDRLNPILSVALLLADENFEELDGIVLKLLPPADTWLEVPIPRDQILGLKPGTHRIDFWLNVHTEEILTTQPMGWLIGPAAVEKNGFVQIKPDGWDFPSMKTWLNDSIPLDQAERQLIEWLQARCQVPPIGVAHFAQFDIRYIEKFMPKLFSCFAVIDPALRAKITEFGPGWYCTCRALQRWNKCSPTPGENAKLGTLAKLSGYMPETEHEAMADAKTCLAGLRWLKTGTTGSGTK